MTILIISFHKAFIPKASKTARAGIITESESIIGFVSNPKTFPSYKTVTQTFDNTLF